MRLHPGSFYIGAPPALSLRFADTKALDSRITYTGGNNRGYWDETGKWHVSGADAARFTHDPSSLDSLGLWIEEQRIWRLLQNRDWTSGAFGTVTDITAAKDATGITGVANSASSLLATGASGVIRQTVTIASAARTASCFVKRVGGTGTIEFTDDGGSNYTDITSSLSTDAWYDFGITRTQANPDIGFRIVTSGDKIEVDMGGLEEGTFKTSPVVVAGSAVTATADVATMLVSSFDFNQAAGTFLVEAQTPDPTTGTVQRIFSVDDGSTTDRVTARINSADAGVRFLTRTGSADTATITLGNAVANTALKVAGAYIEDSVQAALNGTLGTEDTDAAMPSGLTTLRLGHLLGTTQFFNGTIALIEYWPYRMDNLRLQDLTARP